MGENEHTDPRGPVSLETTLDFLNTTELDGGRWVETLPALGDAAAWLVAHGLLDAHEARSLGRLGAARQGQLLAQIRSSRGALREIVDSLVVQSPPGVSALAAVNEILRARPLVELVISAGALVARARPVGDQLEDALVRLADPLVELVSAGETGRLRVCANDGCRWVFEDTSRTGRRRWCSMASCGNRAKAARHRARQRGQPPAAAADSPPTANP